MTTRVRARRRHPRPADASRANSRPQQSRSHRAGLPRPIIAVPILYASRLLTLGVLGWFVLGLPGLAIGLVVGAVLQFGRFLFTQPGLYRSLLGGKPAEVEWVRTDVERLASALAIPTPEIYLADAPVDDENAYVAFSMLRPHRGAMLVLERDWIRALPAQVLASVVAHELGHVTAPSLVYARAYLLLTLSSRLLIFFAGLIATLLGVGHEAWVGMLLALISGSIDLTRLVVERRAEKSADDVAVRLGYGTELEQLMNWAGYRPRRNSRWRSLRLASHPLTGSRRERIARQLEQTPDATPSPTYDGARWHFPPRRLMTGRGPEPMTSAPSSDEARDS